MSTCLAVIALTLHGTGEQRDLPVLVRCRKGEGHESPRHRSPLVTWDDDRRGAAYLDDEPESGTPEDDALEEARAQRSVDADQMWAATFLDTWADAEELGLRLFDPFALVLRCRREADEAARRG